MAEDDDFKTLFTTSLRDGGSFSVSFPVPDELTPFTLSLEYVKRGIEFYLLARYSFLHRMHKAFMTNSFWSVEYLILSILVLKLKGKEELKEFSDYHVITKYWELAKSLVPDDVRNQMGKFDDYVGRVYGYFSERYPKSLSKPILSHTRKMPQVVPGDKDEKKPMRFGKVASLSLDDLDHFVNFMLHDATTYSNDSSGNLMELLASQDNTELYSKENNYSIIYPNKGYFGELGN